ncbi:MAG: ABC transporter ATP-binding protein/permease [Treponema sp.]|jgi:ABC-type multidrug transport system fused ATPase/permease subunit|nr:ABC transporter ATP-binding protein/permease [Treponema sp.]
MSKARGRFIKDILAWTDTAYNAALLLYSLVSLVSSFVIGQSVRLLLNSIQERNFDAFLSCILTSMAALAALVPISYAARFSTLRSAEYVGKRLCIDLFTHITSLPAAYFDTHKAGDLQSRMTFDIQRSTRIFRLDLDYIAKLLLNGIGCIVLMCIIKWEICLLAVACGIIGYMLNIRFLRPVQQSSREISGQAGNMTDTFTGIIRGSSTIRALGLQRWTEAKFNADNGLMKKSGLKLNRIGVLQDGIGTIIASINTFVFLAVSLAFLGRGGLRFGDIMAAFYYSLAVVNLFTDLSRSFSNLQNSYASIIRINEVRELPAEREGADRDAAGTRSRDSALVTFDRVVFSYDGQRTVLNGISFRVQERDILLVKGPSGAGKSTVFKLLLGLYDTGGISICGEDIRAIPPAKLRDMFSYIPQKPVLFRGTIFENIALAKEDATYEDAARAAQKAGIHSFIDSLPEKYDTAIGDDGALLSGGQRQRIAIARAFLKDAPVLLLDEPVSSVDSLNTGVFYAALDELIREKTVLLISHREDGRLLAEKYGDRIKTAELTA